MGATKKLAADVRAEKAIAIRPDPTDRDEIARARHRCMAEAQHARDQIAFLSDLVRGPRWQHHLGKLRDVADRLEDLMIRVVELDAMAKAALHAQVDADPDMAGATVQDDGRLTGVDVGQAAWCVTCEQWTKDTGAHAAHEMRCP